MNENIIINVEGIDNLVVKSGTTINEVVKLLGKEDSVIASSINNEIVELSYILKDDTTLKLITLKDEMGSRIYRSGLKFIYIVAVKELYGPNTNVILKHSLDKGIYSTIDIELNNEVIDKIKNKMHEIVTKNYRIQKVTTSRKEVIRYFNSINEKEKEELYKEQIDDVTTIYTLLDYYNYFYTPMPISTGIIKNFNIELTKDNNIILEYPHTKDQIVPKYTHLEEVLKVFKNYSSWSSMLGVKYVPDLNKIVIDGKIKEFIELNEIKQNNDLLEVSSYIESNIKDIKFILICGPSSSGKTTTSKKLSLYLKSKGINSFVLSTDDFFVERVNTPKNEKGEYLYDIPEAIDIKLFNEKLLDLLNGKETSLPTYNFITGEKEYKGNKVKLKSNDIIIIEGIHTLNDELTKSIDRKNKYKIYISPFTPLGIDRHNHVSTLDIRLIRRLVRDYRTRGYSAVETLKNWSVVRESEEKYIFPYQKDADIVLNTALIYELGMLKTYAIPILLSVPYDSIYYQEALRIITFLKYFIDVPIDTLPNTALLREFVGGGYFE